MSTPNLKKETKEDKDNMTNNPDNAASAVENQPDNDTPKLEHRDGRMEFMMSANDVGYMGFGFNGFGK